MLQHDAVRLEFTDPAAMKRHHLPGALRHGQRDGKTVHLPRLRFQVGYAVPHDQHAAGVQRQLAGQAQARVFIFCRYRQGLSLLLHVGGAENRGTIQPLPVPLNAG